MMLEGLNYRLIVAENGKEAVEKFSEEQPDLILMDIMMPEMDGFEAFSLIKKLDKENHIPIIALTARAMKEEREKIFNFGFDDYISKPINDEELIKKLAIFLKEKTISNKDLSDFS
jgi:CheY-like chemotaxis protein